MTEEVDKFDAQQQASAPGPGGISRRFPSTASPTRRAIRHLHGLPTSSSSSAPRGGRNSCRLGRLVVGRISVGHGSCRLEPPTCRFPRAPRTPPTNAHHGIDQLHRAFSRWLRGHVDDSERPRPQRQPPSRSRPRSKEPPRCLPLSSPQRENRSTFPRVGTDKDPASTDTIEQSVRRRCRRGAPILSGRSQPVRETPTDEPARPLAR